VRIYNNTPLEVTLVPKTRLQSAEGIVFELTDWVKIPTGINDNFNKTAPGYTDISVTSQINDTSGKYI
jgi:hypothetical protein